MNATVIIIAIVVILVIAGLLIYIGARVPKRDETSLNERLTEFSNSGEAVSLDEIEMSQPFMERAIFPFIRQVGEFTMRFTPQFGFQEINRKLELSGKAGWIDAPQFLAARFVTAAFLGGVSVLVLRFTVIKQPLAYALFYSLVVSALGFLLADAWLQAAIKRRQQEILMSMPDVLDLLTICVEAGLGMDATLSVVARNWDSQFSWAIVRAIREIELGKVRRDALRLMAERIDVPEVTSFVALIVQSENLGVSMAKEFRIQSDNIYNEQKERILNELTKIDNWNKALFFILLGPVFILWFAWPLITQLLISPK